MRRADLNTRTPKHVVHLDGRGGPGNEGVGSASSQVAELSGPGSEGSRLPGGADYFQSYQTTPVWLKYSRQEGDGDQGVLTPFCSHTIISSVSPCTPHRSPGREGGRESFLFPCKHSEAQRRSPSSASSHGKVVTAQPSRLPHAPWEAWPDKLTLSCSWPLVVISGRWRMIPQHPLMAAAFLLVCKVSEPGRPGSSCAFLPFVPPAHASSPPPPSCPLPWKSFVLRSLGAQQHRGQPPG